MNSKKVTVEIAERFKITLHNKAHHWGCYYVEDDWDIVVYAPTIDELIDQARERMIQRLIDVDSWELEQCEVILYDGELYEIESSVRDIRKEHSSLVDDIISTNSYKKEYEVRQKELAIDLLKLREHFQKEDEKERKAREKKE
jgi:SHS2 domain-containing protein